MNIRIIKEPITLREVEEIANDIYGHVVKGVVDIEREAVALGGEWHIDANSELILDGSDQRHIWGFNLYPAEKGESALAYTSLINIRPRQGNRTIEVEDAVVRQRMREIISKLIPDLDL